MTPNNEPSTAGATCTICGKRAVCITQMLGNIYPRCSDHPYTEEPGTAGHEWSLAMCCTCGWTCGNNDATKDECKAAQCQHVIEVNKAAGAASTEMAEQVAANHGFYICTCGFLGKEVEVTSKAYVVVAITEATAKLQAEVAALKAKNTNLQESLHTATRIAAANTRDLAAAQQENQRLREALVDAVQWLGLLITSHEGAKHLQELRQALLSAPVALPKGESHE